MATDQVASHDGGKKLEKRLDRLEEIVEQQQNTIDAQEERIDDLESENEDLRDKLEMVSRWHLDLEDNVFGDWEHTTFFDEVGVNSVADAALTASSAGDGGQLSDAAREEMLPIHRFWLHIKDGREGEIPTAAARRGARLFGRFIKRASGEPDTGVNPQNQTYSLSSANAKDILEEAGEMTSGGTSKTAHRAMKAVDRFTKTQEGQEHGLVKFDDSKPTNYLIVNKDKFHEAMSKIEDAVSAAESDTEPDKSDGDVRQAADDKLDELGNAERN